MLPTRCRLASSKNRLSALFLNPVSGASAQRTFSRSAVVSSPSAAAAPNDSIFASTSSAWDHVFDDIEQMPPLFPTQKSSPGLRSTMQPNGNAPTKTRRHAMTAREISAFDDMFNLIFSAVSEQKPSSDAATDSAQPSVGVGKNSLGDLFGKLRRHSKKVKWTTETDELLDRKKEEMDLCDTDQQLLDWAMREVFAESMEYTRLSKEAEKDSSKSSPADLQPPTYPHMVALLIKSFRDKYHDPHLALSIFEHAKHLSIPSYVFGCSTMAYNELIHTKWTCFRDLKGVYEALEEMSVNGIEPDQRTVQIVDLMRKQVGERNTREEENELGSGEAFEMLTKIDRLLQQIVAHRPTPTHPNKKWNEWKTKGADDVNDGWEFDKWEKPAYSAPAPRAKLYRPAREVVGKKPALLW